MFLNNKRCSVKLHSVLALWKWQNISLFIFRLFYYFEQFKGETFDLVEPFDNCWERFLRIHFISGTKSFRFESHQTEIERILCVQNISNETEKNSLNKQSAWAMSTCLNMLKNVNWMTQIEQNKCSHFERFLSNLKVKIYFQDNE